MSFLSRPRRGKSPPVPDHLGDAVTLAQKKRLAMLARMGCGPLADKKDPLGRGRGGSPSRPVEEGKDEKSASTEHRKQMLDRRAALLERERKMREQERREEEEAELEEQKRRAKKQKAGMISLGPVMPREEKALAGSFERAFPTPKPLPSMMEVKISSLTADNVRSSSSSAPGERHEDDAEETVLAMLRNQKDDRRFREASVASKQSARQDQPKKKAKKKKKKGKGEDEEADGGDDDWSDEQPVAQPSKEERKQARDGGAYKNMVVESVKGKVSNDYKGFTDADLERRFGAHGSSSAGGLMSEEQALALIKKEKAKVGHTGSAFKRVQREREEWNAQRQQRMARRSRSREHLVVSHKR